MVEAVGDFYGSIGDNVNDGEGLVCKHQHVRSQCRLTTYQQHRPNATLVEVTEPLLPNLHWDFLGFEVGFPVEMVAVAASEVAVVGYVDFRKVLPPHHDAFCFKP